MTATLYSLRIASGFSVNLARHIRDSSNNDLPLLDILGPKQAVRATWARLKTRKVYNYMLGGHVKLNKEPGHISLKKELPNGWVNWTFVSRQAIPKILDPSSPTYCWRESYENVDRKLPPPNFLPVFTATMPFPVLSDWNEYLWTEGINNHLIKPLTDSTMVEGFKILPRHKEWSSVIKNGFRNKTLNIGIPVPEIPPEPIQPNAQFEKITGNKFPLGQIVSTPAALDLAHQGINLVQYLHRHANCDWGDLDRFDEQANNRALIPDSNGEYTRLFSAYNLDDNEDLRLWIITEADRSSTCMLLPEEY